MSAMDLNIELKGAPVKQYVSKKVAVAAGVIAMAGCYALNHVSHAAGFALVAQQKSGGGAKAAAVQVSASLTKITAVLDDAKAGTPVDCVASGPLTTACGDKLKVLYKKVGTDAAKDLAGAVSDVLAAETEHFDKLEKLTYADGVKTPLFAEVKEVFGTLLGNMKKKGLNVDGLTKVNCQDAIKQDCTTQVDDAKCKAALNDVITHVETAVAAAGRNLKAVGDPAKLEQAKACIDEMGKTDSKSHSTEMVAWMDAMKKLLGHGGVSIFVWIAAGVGGVALVGVLVYLYMMHMKKKKAGASAPAAAATV